MQILDSDIVFSGAEGSIGSQRPYQSHKVVTPLEAPLEDKISELLCLPCMPKVFVHLAAMTSISDCEDSPELCHQFNVEGARQWFRACQEVGVLKFIFASTSHVYDPSACDQPLSTTAPLAPQKVYGKSKLLAEDALKELEQTGSTHLYIARVFSVLADPGPEWSLLEGLKRRARNKDSSPIPGLSFVRDFLTNTEVCKRLVQIAKSEKILPQTLNICSGKGTPIRKLAEIVFKQNGFDLDIIQELPLDDGTPQIIGIPTPID